jgi:hypothetical protein
MNSKKVKRIRKFCQRGSVGKADREYVIVKRPWGAPPAPIRLRKGCTRWMYKEVKKLVKQNRWTA